MRRARDIRKYFKYRAVERWNSPDQRTMDAPTVSTRARGYAYAKIEYAYDIRFVAYAKIQFTQTYTYVYPFTPTQVYLSK